jgi:predicted nucleic acid-binding protein
MIVLDTNVLSALMRQVPDAKAVAWLDEQSRTSVWTTSITILEIRFGLQIMAAGKRRSVLLEAFEGLLDQLEHRIAPFDDEAAGQAADLMALRQRKGRTVELRDTMIAGIVLARHATLATRDLVHFEDLSVPIINPWIV